MGAKTTRLMKLPDGRFATEVMEEHIGGSETHLTYDYYNVDGGQLIDKRLYRLEYWGAIEDRVETSIKEMDAS